MTAPRRRHIRMSHQIVARRRALISSPLAPHRNYVPCASAVRSRCRSAVEAITLAASATCLVLVHCGSPIDTTASEGSQQPASPRRRQPPGGVPAKSRKQDAAGRRAQSCSSPRAGWWFSSVRMAVPQRTDRRCLKGFGSGPNGGLPTETTSSGWRPSRWLTRLRPLKTRRTARGSVACSRARLSKHLEH